MLRLLTFGGLAIVRRDGSPPPRPRPQRLAILAVLAAAGDRGVSRERMSGLFWPDADPDRARHSLRQALYALRQELPCEVTRSGSFLSLDPAVLTTDVGDFRAALAAHDHARAAMLASGPFLQGFFVAGHPDFDRWVEEERTSLTAAAARVMLQLAKEAQAASDADAAVDWWHRLTVLDPLSGRFALGFLKALAARGDRVGALAFARAHESIVRRELEADPDPEILRLEAQLRAMPSPAVVRGKPAAPAGAEAAEERTPPVAGTATTDDRPASDSTEQVGAEPTRASRRRRSVGVTSVALVVLAAVALSVGRLSAALGWSSREQATFAVGLILEEDMPDTLRIGGVLTDMMATNLARVPGLSVLANSRLFELMVPGQDTSMWGYAAAARHAGATEILQGRLLPGPDWGLELELQRVDLETGLVKGGYRVAAGDRYALVDSMTAAIARDLRLGAPESSVSGATTDSPIAYRLYEEGLRAYYQYDGAAARRLMDAALREDSTFAMAAYYQALLTLGDSAGTAAGLRALRLARRAPQFQRLMITARLSQDLSDPSSVFVAETLAVRYPDDPRSLEVWSRSMHLRGDWAGAVRAMERAIALDSAAEPPERQDCRLCDDLVFLAKNYQWWDSLPAAERTAERLLRLRPGRHDAWDILLRSAAARGDSQAAESYFRRLHQSSPAPAGPLYHPRYLTLLEAYDAAGRELQPLLDSPRPFEDVEARWLRVIALRNQGRLAEASALSRIEPVPNELAEALIAIERGDAATAVRIFARRNHVDSSAWAPGVRARSETWNRTLLAMALLAAGDTGRVRRLVDSVSFWGQRSNFGRDRRLHHYLRGMLLVAQRRDSVAVEELKQAIYSPSHGLTRINYELGRALLRLGRPAEAVPVVRAALHGDIDGSNLYMTRTDLHELLAQAFDQLGQRDSAAVHYRAVVRAWERADPVYHARRDSARARLSRQARVPGRSLTSPTR